LDGRRGRGNKFNMKTSLGWGVAKNVPRNADLEAAISESEFGACLRGPTKWVAASPDL